MVIIFRNNERLTCNFDFWDKTDTLGVYSFDARNLIEVTGVSKLTMTVNKLQVQDISQCGGPFTFRPHCIGFPQWFKRT